MPINFFESPSGRLKITCDQNALLSLSFVQEEEKILKEENAVSKNVQHWLESYFSGKIEETKFSIKPQGSPFQKRVWTLLLTIPFGDTLSYKELSFKYGNLKAIRAVAKAIGANPLPIIIPCHRIIGSDGSLVGFSGGLERKQWLLKHEAHHAQGVRELFE